MEKYRFRLREKMPEDFFKNQEISAAIKYLKIFEGNIFKSDSDFRDRVANCFLEYLENILGEKKFEFYREILVEQILTSKALEKYGRYGIYIRPSCSEMKSLLGGLEEITED